MYEQTPAANLTTEATTMQNARAAFHQAAGGKLVALTIIEHIAYPHECDWATVAGAEQLNPGVSVRTLAGGRGHIRQTVVCGDVPDDFCPIVSVA